MIPLELTEEEAGVLKQLLDDNLSDLRMEIADTDAREFRESLKEKKKLLQGIFDRLQAT